MTVAAVVVCVAAGFLLRHGMQVVRDRGRASLAALLPKRFRVAVSVLEEVTRTFWIRRGRWLAVPFLAAAAALAALPQAPGPGRPVTAFTWTYHSQPSPGLRAWTRDAQGRWHERYPDGHEAKVFDLVRQGSVEGCSGSVASASASPAFEVFIPDLGCRSMAARFRWDGGPWSVLGPMSIVSTEPAVGD